MNPEIKKLQDQIDELTRRMNTLQNNATIPFDIGEAFRARILANAGIAETSAKSASSENQAVNEGGAGSYSVLKAPDGFIQVSIAGTVYYIPIFN